MTRWTYASLDDEPAAHEVLRALMRTHADFVEGGHFLKPAEATRALTVAPVDLVFVDARMPGMSGLEWLRSGGQRGLAVLVTAYSEYAMLALGAGVREALLKPLNQVKLDACLDRMRPLLQRWRKAGGERGPPVLAFADGLAHRLVAPGDVLTIDAGDGDAATLVLRDQSLPVTESLADLERRLVLFGFTRVHRKHLVNRAHVVSVRDDALLLSNGQRRPVGLAYADQVEGLRKGG